MEVEYFVVWKCRRMLSICGRVIISRLWVDLSLFNDAV
jgi:hypothetical protein